MDVEPLELPENSLQAFQEYLELRYSPSTVEQYLWAFKSNSPLLRDQKAVDRWLRKKVYSRTNNPFYTGFLKAYIDCFSLPLVVTPSRRKGRVYKAEPKKFLTKKQVDYIIGNTSPYVSLMVTLFFETGLRLRELIDARYDDINPQERTISGTGKGGKPFKVKYSTETSKKVLKWLDSHLYNRPFHIDQADVDHGDRFYYYLKKTCQELGIEGVTPHRFRHALGFHLVNDLKFSLPEAQAKLRHTRVETTGIYAQTTQERVDQKIDAEVFKE